MPREGKLTLPLWKVPPFSDEMKRVTGHGDIKTRVGGCNIACDNKMFRHRLPLSRYSSPYSRRLSDGRLSHSSFKRDAITSSFKIGVFVAPGSMTLTCTSNGRISRLKESPNASTPYLVIQYGENAWGETTPRRYLKNKFVYEPTGKLCRHLSPVSVA